MNKPLLLPLLLWLFSTTQAVGQSFKGDIEVTRFSYDTMVTRLANPVTISFKNTGASAIVSLGRGRKGPEIGIRFEVIKSDISDSLQFVVGTALFGKFRGEWIKLISPAYESVPARAIRDTTGIKNEHYQHTGISSTGRADNDRWQVDFRRRFYILPE